MVKHEDDRGFPADFFWGASTASHQVEGGTYNQWTVWELENAARLAKTAQDRYGNLPIWETIQHQASDPNNYVSGEGVDHFNRYRQDFDLAASLNLNAFRFSVEWSRIEPEEGKWDEAAIAYYRDYIRQLKKRGLNPFLNLWHWTNPVWFEEKGGFAKYGNIKYFIRYAATIIEELGDELEYVLILNEPNIYAWYSYGEGKWPPQKRSYYWLLRVYTNLVLTHRQAYRLLKYRAPHLKLSSAPQLSNNDAKDPSNRLHRFGAWLDDFANNWIWLWVTRRQNDFIGFNCYFKNYASGIGLNKFDNPSKPLNDLGWYMEPSALGEMIRDISQRYPDKPIIVTENGVADAADKHRRWWLEETMSTLKKCRQNGADVIGYFHWSLLDNFEWAEGWWPKFGLVAVDREHGMKRTVRPSAKWWAAELKKNQQRQQGK